jgi:hypothetical protein
MVLEKARAEVIIYQAFQNQSSFIFLEDVITVEYRIHTGTGGWPSSKAPQYRWGDPGSIPGLARF